MAHEGRSGVGLDSVLTLLHRRKWLAVLVFLGPFSAVVGLVPFLPNIYQSTATVLVERQQVPEAFVRSTVTSALETRLQTITQEILSRTRLEELITRFGLYADLKRRVPPEAVIDRMRKDIQFDLNKGLNTRVAAGAVAFTISYRGSEPQAVALVTNTLASFYIEENLKARERQSAGTSEFLKVQVAETKKRLDAQEKELGEFKARHLGELPQFMEANLATLERLHTQLRLNNDSQQRVMDRRQALSRQAGDGDGAGAAAGPEATADRIAKLRQELTQLRTQFRDSYPDVARIKAEIASLEQDLAPARTDGKGDQPERRGGGLIGRIDGELKALKADEAKLRAQVADYERRVQNVPRVEQEFQELTRDNQSTKEMYRTLLGRYEEAQVAESMEQRQKGEQFRIVDPATPSDVPAAPKRSRLILTGMLLSLGLAAGAVLVAEKLDTSFHVVDDLRAFTQFPVLVCITRIVDDAETKRRQLRFRIVAASAVVGVALILGVSYLVARGNEQLVWMLSGGGAS